MRPGPSLIVVKFEIPSILTKKNLLPGHWGGGWAPLGPLVYSSGLRWETESAHGKGLHWRADNTWACPDLPAVDILNHIRKGVAAMLPPAASTVATSCFSFRTYVTAAFSEPLRELLLISLLGEQRHDGCEQFAQDCYPTASRLRLVPGPYCA